MSINVELLRKVQAHIVAHPEQVDMDVVLIHKKSCGTVGCIAGWAVMLGSSKPPNRDDEIWNLAEKLLGLDLHQANELFLRFPPEPLGTPKYAQRVSDHIDKFIAKYAPEAV